MLCAEHVSYLDGAPPTGWRSGFKLIASDHLHLGAAAGPRVFVRRTDTTARLAEATTTMDSSSPLQVSATMDSPHSPGHHLSDQSRQARSGRRSIRSSGVCYTGTGGSLDRSTETARFGGHRERRVDHGAVDSPSECGAGRLNELAMDILVVNTPRLVKAMSVKGIFGIAAEGLPPLPTGTKGTGTTGTGTTGTGTGGTGTAGTGTHSHHIAASEPYPSLQPALHLSSVQRKAWHTEMMFLGLGCRLGTALLPRRGPSIHPQVVRCSDESVRGPASAAAAGPATKLEELLTLPASRTSRTSRTFENIRERSGTIENIRETQAASTQDGQYHAREQPNSGSTSTDDVQALGPPWVVVRLQASKTRSQMHFQLTKTASKTLV